MATASVTAILTGKLKCDMTFSPKMVKDAALKMQFLYLQIAASPCCWMRLSEFTGAQDMREAFRLGTIRFPPVPKH